MFQNIDEVPRHVPSKGCSEILEQTRSITQLSPKDTITRAPWTRNLVPKELSIIPSVSQRWNQSCLSDRQIEIGDNDRGGYRVSAATINATSDLASHRVRRDGDLVHF